MVITLFFHNQSFLKQMPIAKEKQSSSILRENFFITGDEG